MNSTTSLLFTSEAMNSLMAVISFVLSSPD